MLDLALGAAEGLGGVVVRVLPRDEDDEDRGQNDDRYSDVAGQGEDGVVLLVERLVEDADWCERCCYEKRG